MLDGARRCLRDHRRHAGRAVTRHDQPIGAEALATARDGTEVPRVGDPVEHHHERGRSARAARAGQRTDTARHARPRPGGPGRSARSPATGTRRPSPHRRRARRSRRGSRRSHGERRAPPPRCPTTSRTRGAHLCRAALRAPASQAVDDGRPLRGSRQVIAAASSAARAPVPCGPSRTCPPESRRRREVVGLGAVLAARAAARRSPSSRASGGALSARPPSSRIEPRMDETSPAGRRCSAFGRPVRLAHATRRAPRAPARC